MAKDEKVKSIKDILLIGIKTIKKVVSDKNDLSPIVKHVKFLAEKATKKMFEPVACMKYDEAVRTRVNSKGISQFSIIETDEVYSHFSLENTVKVTGKGTVNKKGGWAHLGRFNRPHTVFDFGCKSKCSFLHACYVCDSREHGKQDCPKKSNKCEPTRRMGTPRGIWC